MGDLTKNISRHELLCKCGKCNVRVQDHEPVIQVIQGVCDFYADLTGEKVYVLITKSYIPNLVCLSWSWLTKVK